MGVPGATHFYRYSSVEHLDRLEEIIVKHHLYFPLPAQLNDPAEGRPRLAAMSAQDAERFLHRQWRKEHPDAGGEEEVRLLTPRDAPPQLRFNPELLTQIILGKETAPEHRAKILQWADARDPRLAVRRTEYDAFEQTLRLVRLD